MKKFAAFLTALFVLSALLSVHAEEDADGGKKHIYIFGDTWAAQWGDSLSDFFDDDVEIINCARDGALLSQTERETRYGEVKSGDAVILSYGVMAKDYKSDKPKDFSDALEKTYNELISRSATVLYASICTTRTQNAATGKQDETKNYFTETAKGFFAEKGETYIDLAQVTAERLAELSANSFRLYDGDMTLGEKGKKLCAIEASLALHERGVFTEHEKNGVSIVREVSAGETTLKFDTFLEAGYCDAFCVYIKEGKDVSVNYVPVADGDSETEISKSDRVVISFSSAEAVQLAPVYKYEAQGVKTTASPYEARMRNGVYDIRVKKTEPLKASVLESGNVLVSNLDMPGTEEVAEPSEGVFKKYHVTDGKISITVKGLTDKLDYVCVAESETIFDGKPRIFIGGDSTVCDYYPLSRTGLEADGTVMTGWGQRLCEHTDSVIYNLAESGDWAEKWKEETFPIVEKEGRKGDIFIIQFGINDRDKSSVAEMTAALTYMIDRVAQKGMVPVLLSPQISAGYGWGDETEYGKSDGGGYEEFFDAVRALAEEKGTFYVDLTDMSAGWFSEIGREAVLKKYHIWDYEKDAPADGMHLSFKGADTMCRFVVMKLDELKTAQESDFWGNTLGALTLW